VALIAQPYEGWKIAGAMRWVGSMRWVESTTKAPGGVSGVQDHAPSQRIRDYQTGGGWVDVYRLAPIHALRSRDVSDLAHLLDHFLGHNIGYDVGGAIISGTRLLKFSRLLVADLEALFCSELIAAILQALGRMNRSNPTRHNPASLLRELVRTGTYRRIGRAQPNGPDAEILKFPRRAA